MVYSCRKLASLNASKLEDIFSRIMKGEFLYRRLDGSILNFGKGEEYIKNPDISLK